MRHMRHTALTMAALAALAVPRGICGVESIRSETTGGNGKTRTRPAGRQDKDGPAVMKPEVMLKGIPDLVKLKKAVKEAQGEYDEAKVKLAEKTGFLAATIEKRVNAEANDNLEETKRKVEQLAIAFEVEDK
jgi:hypothetical protein